MKYERFNPWDSLNASQANPASGISKFSDFSDSPSEVKNREKQIAALHQKKAHIIDKYRACQNLRRSKEYKSFSCLTLQAEKEAFLRMNQELAQIENVLQALEVNDEREVKYEKETKP